jgi:DNA-binding response OmpR family regulator
MTACSDDTHPTIASTLGADGFLTKPFCLEEVGQFLKPVP